MQIYALLHRQEVFAPYRQQPRFADLTENIFLVLDYFNAKVGRQPGLCQEVYCAMSHTASVSHWNRNARNSSKVAKGTLAGHCRLPTVDSQHLPAGGGGKE